MTLLPPYKNFFTHARAYFFFNLSDNNESLTWMYEQLKKIDLTRVYYARTNHWKTDSPIISFNSTQIASLEEAAKDINFFSLSILINRTILSRYIHDVCFFFRFGLCAFRPQTRL